MPDADVDISKESTPKKFLEEEYLDVETKVWLFYFLKKNFFTVCFWPVFPLTIFVVLKHTN